MTPVTQLCYRPRLTVLTGTHSDTKSQVMDVLVMAKCGQVTSVVEAVRLYTTVSTSLPQVLNSTVVPATFRVAASLGFGVIGVKYKFESNIDDVDESKLLPTDLQFLKKRAVKVVEIA